MQLTFDDLPRARATDPNTSHMAARVARTHAQRDRDRVLILLRAISPDALTDFEIAERLAGQQTSLGVRRGELVKQHLVEWSGDYGLSPSGSSCRKWRAVVAFVDVPTGDLL